MQILEVRPSAINKEGCFTLIPIRKRRKIADYKGELIQGRRKIDVRVGAQTKAGAVKIIRFGNGALGIDGAAGGDATACINHSCQPNAFMREVPGRRVMFFALRDIAAGEEITIDYRDPGHPPADGCRCGAEGCRSRVAERRRGRHNAGHGTS